MTTVWVLLVIGVKKQFIGPTKVDMMMDVYSKAEVCLHTLDEVTQKLQKQYNEFNAHCLERKINE